MMNENQKMTTPQKLLGASVMIAVGLLIICGSVIEGTKSFVIATEWPRTEGTVIDSYLSPQRGKGKFYALNVRYRFTFEGREYSTDCIDSSSYIRNRAEGEECLKKYPIGGAIRVFVNRDDPEFSVLIPGEPSDSRIPFAIGSIVVIVGCVIWSIHIYRWSRNKLKPLMTSDVA